MCKLLVSLVTLRKISFLQKNCLPKERRCNVSTLKFQTEGYDPNSSIGRKYARIYGSSQ